MGDMLPEQLARTFILNYDTPMVQLPAALDTPANTMAGHGASIAAATAVADRYRRIETVFRIDHHVR
jgi:hypothetical protein